MAGRRYAHRLFTSAEHLGGAAVGSGDEFDESEVLGGYSGAEQRHKPVPAAPPDRRRKSASTVSDAPVASLPVGIPDWSKIPRGENSKNKQRSAAHLYNHEEEEEGDEIGGATAIIPPHELLIWRNRGTSSFSVYEGRGRTLKGRDLSRVRDAVWEQTGFQE